MLNLRHSALALMIGFRFAQSDSLIKTVGFENHDALFIEGFATLFRQSEILHQRVMAKHAFHGEPTRLPLFRDILRIEIP